MRPFTTIILVFISAHLWAQEASSTGWVEHTELFSNTGQLEMWTYKPSTTPAFPQLVVLLHGCDQGPKEFAIKSGWKKLADQESFYLLCPGQRRMNNFKKCFNWFRKPDVERTSGEVHSIYKMIQKVKQDYTISQDKIYVVGFSAGGGMAMAVLSAYPEVFKAGAIFAGIPYRAAENYGEAADVMMNGAQKTPGAWGNLIESLEYRKYVEYPPIAVFHGNDDPVVHINNAYGIISQWTNVQKTDTVPDLVRYPYEAHTNVRKIVYKDSLQEQTTVEFYKIQQLGHAYPVYPGNYSNRGGQRGEYFNDVGFWGTYEAARFFDIIFE